MLLALLLHFFFITLLIDYYLAGDTTPTLCPNLMYLRGIKMCPKVLYLKDYEALERLFTERNNLINNSPYSKIDLANTMPDGKKDASRED